MKEEDGKPKGFAYIEFREREGLLNALKANSTDFCGRPLNMDVAKPPRSFANTRTSGNRQFGDRPFGDNRYDNSWGPGAGGARSFNYPQNRSSFGGRGGPPDTRGPSERPRLNLQFSKPPSAQATQLHDTISKPKGSFENPFGNADVDSANKKMDEAEKKRIEREKELLEKQKEESRNAYARKAQTPRGTETPTNSNTSWRNNPKQPLTSRRDEPREPPRAERTQRPKPAVVIDEDGFKSTRRGWEKPPVEKPTTVEPAVKSTIAPKVTKPTAKANKKSVDTDTSTNIYDNLEEQELT
jgi:RNA recognition motif-containing protein